MSKIALGTAQFGLDYGVSNARGQVPFNDVEEILGLAQENSIDTLDTAAGYGSSETVLGQAGVCDFKIVTKTAPLHLGVDVVLETFRRSLKLLNIPNVYALLIHNMGDVKNENFNSLCKALEVLKNEDLIAKTGFSAYEPSQVDFLLENFDFDLIQIPYNVFDTRLLEGGQLRLLKERKIEIHARSIFLQGLLLTDSQKRPKFFNKWRDLFQNWDMWLQENGISGLEAAIGFVLSENLIDKVVIGVDKVSHLAEVISASQACISNIPGDINTNDEKLLNPSFWELD